MRAAGHEPVLYAPGVAADVVVVDLTTGELPEVDAEAPRLGFYLHTDQDTRERAEAAGYDLVVPRSRMHREGPALAERLASA